MITNLLATNNIDWIPIATLIAAGSSFVGVIIDIIVRHFLEQKTRQKDVITANRVHWMEAVREQVSDSTKIVHAYLDGNCETAKDIGVLNDFCKVKNLVSLLLNFNGYYDNKIRLIFEKEYDMMKDILVAQENDDQERAIADKEIIIACENYKIRLTSIYLKCEWERVKHLSKKGENAFFNFDERFEKYLDVIKDEMNTLYSIINREE